LKELIGDAHLMISKQVFVSFVLTAARLSYNGDKVFSGKEIPFFS